MLEGALATRARQPGWGVSAPRALVPAAKSFRSHLRTPMRRLRTVLAGHQPAEDPTSGPKSGLVIPGETFCEAFPIVQTAESQPISDMAGPIGMSLTSFAGCSQCPELLASCLIDNHPFKHRLDKALHPFPAPPFASAPFQTRRFFATVECRQSLPQAFPLPWPGFPKAGPPFLLGRMLRPTTIHAKVLSSSSPPSRLEDPADPTLTLLSRALARYPHAGPFCCPPPPRVVKTGLLGMLVPDSIETWYALCQ
ncbi:hypothetical protein M2388_001239 [Leucobacter aridicollis]|nr:hypothetical protein [Leucobacter aridicollis]